MEDKNFAVRLDARQLIMLLPALVMCAFAGGFFLWGDPARFAKTGGLLLAMSGLWVVYGLIQLFGQRYRLTQSDVLISAGMKTVRLAYTNIHRVMLGDVAMPGSRMARGALMLQPENNGQARLLYPKEMGAFIEELRKRAPQAEYLTTPAELDAYRQRRKQAKQSEEN